MSSTPKRIGQLLTPSKRKAYMDAHKKSPISIDDQETLQPPVNSLANKISPRKVSAAANNKLSSIASISSQQQQQQQVASNSNSTAPHTVVGDDFILASLVESGFIVGSIKTVFERGKQSTFSHSIEKFMERQTSEIKNVCALHFDEFLKSVSQLKLVRNESLKLKDKISDVNDEIQSAGKIALEKGKELLEYRTIGENISKCLKSLEACRFVASLACKASDQVKQQKYYPALITIEQLERELYKPQHLDSKLTEFFEKHIPRLKLMIRGAVEMKFTDWLQKCRRQGMELGRLMLQLTQQKMLQVASQKQNVDDVDGGAMDPLLASDSILYSSYEEENVFEMMKFDFTPVYMFKHIFETLNLLEDFKAYYRQNRRIQLESELKNVPLFNNSSSSSNNNNLNEMSHEPSLLLPSSPVIMIQSPSIQLSPPPIALEKSTVQLFEEWLCKILGYFAIEHAILHSMSSALSTGEVNQQWENAATKIIASFKYIIHEQENNYRENTVSKQDAVDSLPVFILRMKQSLIKFCFTVQQKLSLNVAEIIDLLETHKENFIEILTLDIQQKIRTAIMSDKCIALEVMSSQHLQTLVQYGLVEKSIVKYEQNDRFLPFSVTVVELLEYVAFQYADLMFSYSQYLASMDAIIRQGMFSLLNFISDTLDKSMLHNSTSPSLAVYAQISINADYLARATLFLEQHYFKKLSQQSLTTTNLQLTAAAASASGGSLGGALGGANDNIFKTSQQLLLQTKSKADEFMLRAIIKNVEDMLSLYDSMEWAPTQLPVSSSNASLSSIVEGLEPRSFISDLVRYLEATYNSLRYTPREKREYYVFSSCQSVAKKIHSILFNGNQVPMELNLNAVKIVRKDIEAFEQLANRINSQKCKFCFVEISSVLDFLFKQELQYKGNNNNKFIEEVATSEEKVKELVQVLEQQLGNSDCNKKFVNLMSKLAAQIATSQKGALSTLNRVLYAVKTPTVHTPVPEQKDNNHHHVDEIEPSKKKKNQCKSQ